jgi:hypothetical protein
LTAGPLWLDRNDGPLTQASSQPATGMRTEYPVDDAQTHSAGRRSARALSSS